MKTQSNPALQRLIKRPAGWIIGLSACVLMGIGIYLLASDVHIIQATDDSGDILMVQQINADSTLTSRYIHSVARCPMIEKFQINKTGEIVLTESWNCSFGAGIEYQTPEGATTREEDGFFIYEGLNKPFKQLSIHAVKLNEYTVTIDGQTYELSKNPYLGKTITFEVMEQTRFSYLFGKITQ
ncbi:hypothetical protein JNUCC1_00998 [Lentibacillus sp. JNUCC-1]|uniref:DUF1850 domain-containing protein n=1 Tax=Lentibacillus sp. JNUCC-1 TaxID=2654513 RepID=UPI0012E8D74C|nr:DUF1850 domain-containing protein [Lentibacillus sp. JNUCC-1]MUV37192.1 hypothetical protein [Lentibacillus sp. JNUCC-1]